MNIRGIHEEAGFLICEYQRIRNELSAALQKELKVRGLEMGIAYAGRYISWISLGVTKTHAHELYNELMKFEPGAHGRWQFGMRFSLLLNGLGTTNLPVIGGDLVIVRSFYMAAATLQREAQAEWSRAIVLSRKD